MKTLGEYGLVLEEFINNWIDEYGFSTDDNPLRRDDIKKLVEPILGLIIEARSESYELRKNIRIRDIP